VTPNSPGLLTDLFAKYHRVLGLYVWNLVKCDQTAEEIVQETYARIASGSSKGPIDHPRAYLFRSARNIALDHLRRKRLRVVDDSVELDGDTVAGSLPTPEDNLMHSQAQERFKRAIRELPPKTRRVFYYRRYEGLTVKHVAAKMNMSERQVYKHMEDAMQHLALRLKGNSR